MADQPDRKNERRSSGNHKKQAPDHQGGDQIRKAQEWGGGSKGSKGAITKSDKKNPNSSSKS